MKKLTVLLLGYPRTPGCDRPSLLIVGLAVLFLLVCSAHAQVYELRGGSSTLFGASGGAVNFYGSRYGARSVSGSWMGHALACWLAPPGAGWIGRRETNSSRSPCPPIRSIGPTRFGVADWASVTRTPAATGCSTRVRLRRALSFRSFP
jgi:hypothetical protein